MKNELREKLIKAKSQEEVVELLKADGQDASNAEKIWDEILKEQEKDGRSLSMDELDAVSGGILGLGDDAPDGHELSCIFTWYNGWDDFDKQNASTYCAGTKGRKHEFDHFEQVTKYGIIDPTDMITSYDFCKLCGYKMNEKFYMKK